MLIVVPFIAGISFSIYQMFEKGNTVSTCFGCGLVLILIGSFLVDKNQVKP